MSSLVPLTSPWSVRPSTLSWPWPAAALSPLLPTPSLLAVRPLSPADALWSGGGAYSGVGVAADDVDVDVDAAAGAAGWGGA